MLGTANAWRGYAMRISPRLGGLGSPVILALQCVSWRRRKYLEAS
jgi:hypothetical protein